MVKNQWLGQTLGGRYKIEELLGQGGMSAVFRASDPNLRRTVAVKIIHPHLVDHEEFVRRFEEEAAAVARLRHPNIIQIYDFNHDSGLYYMVMEYVSGESLLERIRRLRAAGRQLPYAETMRCITQICEALDYAHQRNMIHRDIKPANMMIDSNGQAILMDFGIAKIIGGQQHTATGAVVGTALYMSPEQIRSERFDHRTDIYSLGVTLFEMVHGRPPFEAESTMALLMMHLNEAPPDLRNLRPDIPPALVEIIEKAMQKEPGGRYQSAGEMAAALRRAQAGLQGAATASLKGEKVQLFAPAAQATARPALSGPAPQPQSRPGAAAFPGGSSAPQPFPARPDRPARQLPRRNAFLAGGCAVILLAAVCFLGGGVVLYNQMLAPGSAAAGPAALFSSTQTALAATREALVTFEAAFALEPSDTAAAPPAVTPTDTTAPPTLAPSPTTDPNLPTPLPPGFPFVLLVSAAQEGDHYRVVYETVGFIESLEGRHIHFYYNNVTEADAGASGQGAFMMHPGPRPFIGALVSERPPDATQICATAAEPNHEIIPNSGSCIDLPAPEPTAVLPPGQPTRQPPDPGDPSDY